MGRLIDEDPIYVMGYNRGFKNGIKASIPKADYEARLKADMVAMLTDIQLEIEELKNEPACCHHFVRGVNRCSEVIQQKIDALKGVQRRIKN